MWAQLQDQIKIRTKRLASAAEIHGFNRDLNELIARLQEKDASLSMEDLGRDMASVQGLQRKHEGHERDLVVVQKQVETLSAQSAKLQVAYQGEAINMLYFLYLSLFYSYNLIHQDWHETIATNLQASSTVIANSLCVLSLYRSYNLDFCVGIIFNRNG